MFPTNSLINSKLKIFNQQVKFYYSIAPYTGVIGTVLPIVTIFSILG